MTWCESPFQKYFFCRCDPQPAHVVEKCEPEADSNVPVFRAQHVLERMPTASSLSSPEVVELSDLQNQPAACRSDSESKDTVSRENPTCASSDIESIKTPSDEPRCCSSDAEDKVVTASHERVQSLPAHDAEPAALPAGFGVWFNPGCVQPGIVLVCEVDTLLYASPTSWEEVNRIVQGDEVVAAGRYIECDGYKMVPISPLGAVDFNAFRIKQGSSFSASSCRPGCTEPLAQAMLKPELDSIEEAVLSPSKSYTLPQGTSESIIDDQNIMSNGHALCARQGSSFECVAGLAQEVSKSKIVRANSAISMKKFFNLAGKSTCSLASASSASSAIFISVGSITATAMDSESEIAKVRPEKLDNNGCYA